MELVKGSTLWALYKALFNALFFYRKSTFKSASKSTLKSTFGSSEPYSEIKPSHPNTANRLRFEVWWLSFRLLYSSIGDLVTHVTRCVEVYSYTHTWYLSQTSQTLFVEKVFSCWENFPYDRFLHTSNDKCGESVTWRNFFSSTLRLIRISIEQFMP